MSTPTGRGLPEKIGHYTIVSELGAEGWASSTRLTKSR